METSPDPDGSAREIEPIITSAGVGIKKFATSGLRPWARGARAQQGKSAILGVGLYLPNRKPPPKLGQMEKLSDCSAGREFTLCSGPSFTPPRSLIESDVLNYGPLRGL